jgi:two-component system sensor histidine kinase DesK
VLHPRRHWSELSRAERVGLYTRQSLYVLLWGFNATVLLVNGLDLDDRSEAAALLGGGFAVTALGFALLVDLLRRYPVVHPLPWRRLGPLLAVSAVYLLVATGWSDAARGSSALVVVATVALTLSWLPDPRHVAALILGSGVLFGVLAGTPLAATAGVIAAASFVFTGRASMWLFGIAKELEDASQAQAQLAVAEERLRFSRDVHDVLGRRLSTIAVQAELAATLSARGDERAAAQMLEVRAVAHEALREARELARGYRATDLLKELEGARSLLRSAGIDVRLSVDDMPRAWHEAAAWVVRESVTNVLRHSSARVVEISFEDGRLRVDNDGARPGESGDGAGLRGLRERLSPLGAGLVAQAYDGDRWVVEAEFPGSGPLSATGRNP